MADDPKIESDTDKLTAKVDQLAKDLLEYKKVGNRRDAKQTARAIAIMKCMTEIKENTAPVQRIRQDAEGYVRIVSLLRAAFFWFIAHIALPIVTLVALVYLAMHGNWPAWFSSLKALLS